MHPRTKPKVDRMNFVAEIWSFEALQVYEVLPLSTVLSVSDITLLEWISKYAVRAYATPAVQRRT